MRENLDAEHAELLKKYHDLVGGLRMIRRAVEKTFNGGASIEPEAATPLLECKAIERSIYVIALKQKYFEPSPGDSRLWDAFLMPLG